MPTTVHPTATNTRIAHGALAGIIGGIVFGVLMAMTGMLPMIGMLIGVPNPAVGFAVHLVNSAIIGTLFGLVSRPLAGTIGPLLATGLGYGVLWWVLGALLIMPLWLSLTADPTMRAMVFHIGQAQWLSLVGHVLYGLVTAAALYALHRRTATGRRPQRGNHHAPHSPVRSEIW